MNSSSWLLFLGDDADTDRTGVAYDFKDADRPAEELDMPLDKPVDKLVAIGWAKPLDMLPDKSVDDKLDTLDKACAGDWTLPSQCSFKYSQHLSPYVFGVKPVTLLNTR